MTWTEDLADELRRRGISGPRRAAIVLEFEDHIACEPASVSRLGNPRELAGQFADELAAERARGATRATFGALTLAAIALIASQVTIGAAGGYPGIDTGRSLILGLVASLCMVVAPQVALVAGSLGLLRALRRRREPVLPAAEIRLLRRRTWVGLAGGLVSSSALELYVLNFSGIEPAWWLWMVGELAGLSLVGLAAAAHVLRRDVDLVASGTGPAGDIFDDLPLLRPLHDRPWQLCAIVAGGVGLATTLAAWHAERSLAEGLQRGIFEGLAAAAGFAVLGRAIGARR